MSNDDTPKTDLSYDAALHAIQSGVATEMSLDNEQGATTPKHLRTGIDSVFVANAALARLLVKKGLFTEEEYREELRLEACREVDRYEARINAKLGPGKTVTLR